MAGYSTELPVGLLGLIAHTGVAQFVSHLRYHSNLIGKVVEVNLGEQCRTAYTPCMSVAHRDL